MRLSSTAFSDRSAIPSCYTCDGENFSPPLSWDDAPKGTRSFVLLCDDPDAPAGTWHHWAVYDIPAVQRVLAEGAARSGAATGLRQATNDFRQPGYGGPCPPLDHGVHRYHFRLLALSVDHLSLKRNPTCVDVERAARKHQVAEATLVGLYER